MYEGKCQGCDGYGPVDDQSLCEDCAAQVDESNDEDWSPDISEE